MKPLHLIVFLFLLGCSKPDYDDSGCYYFGYTRNVDEYGIYMFDKQFHLNFSDSASTELRLYIKDTFEHFWTESSLYQVPECGPYYFEVYKYVYKTLDKKHSIQFIRTSFYNGENPCNNCFYSWHGTEGQRDIIIIDSIKAGFASTLHFNNENGIELNNKNDTITLFLSNAKKFRKLEWKSKKLQWEAGL